MDCNSYNQKNSTFVSLTNILVNSSHSYSSGGFIYLDLSDCYSNLSFVVESSLFTDTQSLTQLTNLSAGGFKLVGGGLFFIASDVLHFSFLQSNVVDSKAESNGGAFLLISPIGIILISNSSFIGCKVNNSGSIMYSQTQSMSAIVQDIQLRCKDIADKYNILKQILDLPERISSGNHPHSFVFDIYDHKKVLT